MSHNVLPQSAIRQVGGVGLIFVLFLLSSLSYAQGFLEMPETEEVPEYERESMLLDLDVPPVRDRDPDPEAGPRLNIKEFKLQGLVEYPDLGITRSELIKRVEGIRFDLMNEGELTNSGYTLDELGEVSDLIADIERESAEEHVGALEVQKLVFLIREQRRRRGVTLGMIETVADTITQFYRERGFILAKAYIPEQKVRDGVVTLTLLLGELGEIKLENNKRVSERLVNGVFKRDLNKPVTSWNIEESLYLINDIPGLSAQGFFSPGDQVGDTKLSVNVLEESWFSGNLRLDNHGSENTSENRAYLDFYLHNPLGYGDEVYVAILNSFAPSNSTYGAIRYSSFLWSPRYRAEIGFSTNDFASRNAGKEAQEFTGESEVHDISFAYIFSRSRVKNMSVDLGYMNVSTLLDADSPTIQKTKVIKLGFNFDILNQKWRQLYIGRVSLANANTETNIFTQTPGSHLIFNYDLSVLSFLKFPFTQAETRLVLRSVGQYSGEAVSNLNQLSLTGPDTTRAFSVNGFQSDDAFYFGADWIFNSPKFNNAKFFGRSTSKVFQPYIFFDWSFGKQQPFVSGDETSYGRLADIGAGIKFNHSDFSASLFFATPLVDEVILLKDETPTTGVYFEFQYMY